MSPNIIPVSGYPIGARVEFVDQADAVRLPGVIAHAVGTVNGQAIRDDYSDVVYVPVFADRVGREATTIYVNAANILAVEAQPREVTR